MSRLIVACVVTPIIYWVLVFILAQMIGAITTDWVIGLPFVHIIMAPLMLPCVALYLFRRYRWWQYVLLTCLIVSLLTLFVKDEWPDLSGLIACMIFGMLFWFIGVRNNPRDQKPTSGVHCGDVDAVSKRPLYSRPILAMFLSSLLSAFVLMLPGIRGTDFDGIVVMVVMHMILGSLIFVTHIFLLPLYKLFRRKVWFQWWQVGIIGATIGLVMFVLFFLWALQGQWGDMSPMPAMMLFSVGIVLSSLVFWYMAIRKNPTYQKLTSGD